MMPRHIKDFYYTNLNDKKPFIVKRTAKERIEEYTWKLKGNRMLKKYRTK